MEQEYVIARNGVNKAERAAVSVLVGVGNPLMDVLIDATDADLSRLEVIPGSMNLVDRERQEEVLRLGAGRELTAGGSCANTLRGVAWVAGAETDLEIAYCGAVGGDRYGDSFADALGQSGVAARLARVDAETGTSVILVTPDYERTMFTHLGACRELQQNHLATLLPPEFDHLHLTGYMWDTENQRTAAEWVIAAAHERGARVSFDLADTFVVARYRDALVESLPGRVDILFGNLDELRRMNGTDGTPATTAEVALRYAPTVVLKAGSEGCWVARRDMGPPIHVPAFLVEACDTTGAGDSFAAGYLAAHLIGEPPAQAARVANRVAAGIVSVYGCDYDRLDRAAVIREARSRDVR